MPDSHIPPTPVPTHQADATLSQNNPVSTTLYTVLTTTANVRIISIAAQVTWSGQPNPLEIVLTIDGQTITYAFANPVSTTFYECIVNPGLAATAQILVAALITDGSPRACYRAFLMEGRSVLIQARTTGGTVSNLSARVKYAKW